ncbi:MAG: response regulator [Bacteroidetes bacterium]|nr:response regulator [Bacteroidota bacterium]
MKIKILIVEDELIIAEDIKVILETLGYETTGIACNYIEAETLLKEKKPDIVLVDINLGNSKDGIELAEYINYTYNIPLIFVTSNADPLTLEKAKKVNSHGYLLKPFTKEDLYASIEIGISNFQNQSSANSKIKDAIFIRENNLFVKVLLQDILWLKSDGNYTEIITVNKQYLARGTVKITQQELDSRFLRVHKSFVININRIDALAFAHVVINKQEIPIGKQYKNELMSRFNTL